MPPREKPPGGSDQGIPRSVKILKLLGYQIQWFTKKESVLAPKDESGNHKTPRGFP